MPMFEYVCRECRHPFERLIRAGDTPSCPSCSSTDLERQISIPAVKSESTHQLALNAARRRDTALGAEKARQQREYELSHND